MSFFNTYSGLGFSSWQNSYPVSPQTTWAPVTQAVSSAKWKTPQQLIAHRESTNNNEALHGKTIPIGRGAIQRKGDLFYATRPRKVDGEIIADFGMGFFRNEFQRDVKLIQVKMDDKVIFSTKGEARTSPSGGSFDIMRVYDGIDNRADPFMLDKDGEENTPNYEGYVYIFFEKWRLKDFNFRIPICVAEWTDNVQRTDTSDSFPLIAGNATFPRTGGNKVPKVLCYDDVLKRAYTTDRSDGTSDRIQIGTSDFGLEAETNLVEIIGFPETGIGVINNGVALNGTGLILCVATGAVTGKNYDLLINADTGVVLDYVERVSTERVRWGAALPLSGGSETRWIAVGWMAETSSSFTFPVACMGIMLNTGTIETLVYGTNNVGNSGTAQVTPGDATSTKTTFYVRQFERLTEIRFSGYGLPTYHFAGSTEDEVDGTPKGGIYYDVSTNPIMASVQDGADWFIVKIKQSNFSTDSIAVDGDADTGYEVIRGGGSFHASSYDTDRAILGSLRPGYCLLARPNPNGDSMPSLLNIADMTISELPSIDGFSEGFDVYDQDITAGYNLDETEWLIKGSSETTAAITVAEILEDLAVYAGYDRSDVTTINLDSSTVRGFYLERDATVQDLVSQICQLFSAHVVEREGGVTFIRKSAVTAEI